MQNRRSISDFFTAQQLIDIGGRIRQKRLSKKATMSFVSQSIQVKETAISDTEVGRLAPGSKFLVDFCILFSVSPDWILFGKGKQTIKCGKFDWVDVGLRIKNLRGNISRLRLSGMSGSKSTTHLDLIETAQIIPYLHTLLRFCAVFRVSLDYILFGVTSRPRLSICIQCGKTTNGNKFCSVKCKDAYHTLKRVYERTLNGKCPQCGKPYDNPPGVNKSNISYCGNCQKYFRSHYNAKKHTKQ